MGSYFDVAVSGDGHVWLATLVPYALAFGYCLHALSRALRGRPHDAVAAACGAIQASYLVFVWLCYDQPAGANYSTLPALFAVSLGCAVVAAAGRLGASTGTRRAALAMTLAVALVPLIVNTHRRDHRDIPLSINLHAERALAAHLEREPRAPVVVTTNALVGVPEAFAGIRSVRLDLALGRCAGTEAETERCRRQVLVETLRALPEARFIVPVATGVVDKTWEQRMAPALADAARVLEAHMHEEARFTTRDGQPVLALMRLAAHPRP
jgi:hypothetical protein